MKNMHEPVSRLLRATFAFLLGAFALSLAPGGAAAQDTTSTQRAAAQDTASTASQDTSRAEVPRPESVFGFRPGADYKLASYDQMLRYYEQLAAASARVELKEIGTSTAGRPMLLLFISSEENLADLERWRSMSEQLARARVDSSEAQRLASEGKAVVWIDGGMHATETAHAQMTPELAWRVATEESSEMQKIRENVVFLLMPVMNPDGLEIVRNWYERVLETPYETSSPPWLYQKYVGHDNNRDYFMNNMAETRAVTKVLYREWYPQIVYNQHQTSPAWARIFIPPFSDPVNPHIHAGVVAGVNEVGAAMARRFALEGKPGVVSRNSYTMFWNGGGRTTPYFHNQIGILTETGHSTPTPRYYEPDSIPDFIGDGVPTDSTAIFYTEPWRGGESHLRDAVEYMLTASVATLDLAADRRENLLSGIYQMGRDAVEAGEEQAPRAYVIPVEGQRDQREAINLVNVLRYGGVELERATEAFEAGGRQYEAGAYVARTAQAFRPYLMDLMEKQRYPTRLQYPDGPPDAPYDLAGWTLPLQMGVEVARIEEAFEVSTEEVTELAEVEPGQVLSAEGDSAGSGAAADSAYGWALSPRSNASVEAVNRLLASGAKVYWSGEALEGVGGSSGGDSLARPGSLASADSSAADSSAAGAQQYGAGTYVIELTDSTQADSTSAGSMQATGGGSAPADRVRTRAGTPAGNSAQALADSAQALARSMRALAGGMRASNGSTQALVDSMQTLADSMQTLARSMRTLSERAPASSRQQATEGRGSALADSVRALARELGVDFAALAERPSGTLYEIKRAPRVGLYKSWVASMDEGWTRWVLERYAFPLDTLHDADIREADLGQYDAIILPSQGAEAILQGHRAGTMPEEYVGGLGLEGALALKRYVEEGGTLIAFDAATEFAIEQLGLPVRNAVAGLSDEEFFIPGSLMRMKVATEHPLAAGVPEEVVASFSRSRAFEVVRPDRMGEGGFEETKLGEAPPVEVVAHYAEKDVLMSGWAIGEQKHLAGKPSLLHVRQGEGSAVLFGFRPQFRGQPRGTYRLIFNALHGATVEEELPQVGQVAADPRADQQ